MSPAWLELCSIVCRILKAQNVSLVFNPYEKFTVRQQVGRTATLIVPLALKQFFFITGLTHDKLAIRLATGRILLAVMSKVTEFQDTLMKSPKAGGYNEAEKAAIMHNLKGIHAHLTSRFLNIYYTFLNLSRSVTKVTSGRINGFQILPRDVHLQRSRRSSLIVGCLFRHFGSLFETRIHQS